GSVLKYMTDKNRPVTPPAQKGLFLTEDCGIAQAATSQASSHIKLIGPDPTSVLERGSNAAV
ncbi:hypothetical protein, partial [uncultured Desulfovibrio sp.]